MAKKRLASIDVAKGILILYLLMGHALLFIKHKGGMMFSLKTKFSRWSFASFCLQWVLCFTSIIVQKKISAA